MNAKNILTVKGKGVITISPNQTIQVAILRMAKHNIGSLVVVDEAYRMVGILTERHIVRQVASVDNLLSKLVGEVMETQVITGIPQDNLNSIIHLMTEKRIRHLPIFDDGKLVGLISIGDILKVQRDEYRGQVNTLETQVMAD